MQDEIALLRKYSEARDAEAFTELIHSHAGMVYGTCLRIIGDEHD